MARESAPDNFGSLIEWDGVTGPEPLDQPYYATDWNVVAYRCGGCGRGATAVSLRNADLWRAEHASCQRAAAPAPRTAQQAHGGATRPESRESKPIMPEPIRPPQGHESDVKPRITRIA